MPLKFLVLFICLCLSGATRSQGQTGAHTDWNFLDSPPFQIYYLDPDKAYIEEIASLVQIAYLDFVTRLNLNAQTPVSIFVCPTEKVFNKLTGNFIPHWGEGVADPLNNLIVLKSPSLTDNHDRLPKLIRHELVHILIGQNIYNPQDLPTWFNEGIAIYLSADDEFTRGKAISTALLSESIIPLDEIDDVLQFQHGKARLAYEESGSFVLYLVDKYGFKNIAQLLAELGKDVAFNEVFADIYGTDVFDEELKWYGYIEKKYRWHFLADFGAYLWIFVLLLFIVVFMAIKMRNRRTLKKWDEEERLAGF